jgi:hypothetical protein
VDSAGAVQRFGVGGKRGAHRSRRRRQAPTIRQDRADAQGRLTHARRALFAQPLQMGDQRFGIGARQRVARHGPVEPVARRIQPFVHRAREAALIEGAVPAARVCVPVRLGELLPADRKGSTHLPGVPAIRAVAVPPAAWPSGVWRVHQGRAALAGRTDAFEVKPAPRRLVGAPGVREPNEKK